LRVSYLARAIDAPELEIQSGASRINATAHYDHPAGDLQTGQARFTIATDRLDLGRVATVQQYRAGVSGLIDLNLSGSMDVIAKEPRVLLTALDGNISATGIASQGKQFGNLKLTANTRGSRLSLALDSDLAGSTIHGSGSATLNAQYPVEAQLSFRNVTW